MAARKRKSRLSLVRKNPKGKKETPAPPLPRIPCNTLRPGAVCYDRGFDNHNPPAVLKPGVAMFTMGDYPVDPAIHFLCPCGCGEAISIEMNSACNFSLTIDRNGITLYPRYRRKTGCLSHFRITDGKVEFMPGSGVNNRPDRL